MSCKECENLKEKLKLAVSALESIYTQEYGHQHNWAGMFRECRVKKVCTSWHRHQYAYSGNWKSREDICPLCQAHEALASLQNSGGGK